MDSEETYGMRVLQPLNREPAAPSTVDIERAIADGRRHQRVRRAVGYTTVAGVTALALLALPTVAGAPRQTAAAPTTAPAPTGVDGSAEPTATPPVVQPAPAPPKACVVSKLPVLDGDPMSIVTGADPTGRFILGRSYGRSGGAKTVLIWDAMKPSKVDMPGDDVQLGDISSSGIAVGLSFVDGEVTPWLYRDHKLTQLPGVTSGGAHAINDAGVIAGYRIDADGHNRPVIWPTLTSPAVDLPVPDGWTGEAYDVDDDGTVVGTLAGPRGIERGYLWAPDGTRRELPKPHEAGPGSIRAFTIRNGWVTGIAHGDNGAMAVRWNIGSGQVSVFLKLNVRADMANKHGWLVGSDQHGQGLFVSDLGPLLLPDLVQHRDPLDVIATTLSDDGRVIAGQAEDGDEVYQAVVWECAP